MYAKVCETMVLHKPYLISCFDRDVELNSDTRINFSYVEDEIQNERKRLSNGLWMDIGMDAEDCENLCKIVLGKCGYPLDSLTVKTKEAQLING